MQLFTTTELALIRTLISEYMDNVIFPTDEEGKYVRAAVAVITCKIDKEMPPIDFVNKMAKSYFESGLSQDEFERDIEQLKENGGWKSEATKI